MTGAKKVKILKNHFLHACQPRKEIFEIHTYRELFFMALFWNFEFLFLIGGTFFQKFFWLKSLLIVSTLAGLMWSRIREYWMTSSTYLLINLNSVLRKSVAEGGAEGKNHDGRRVVGYPLHSFPIWKSTIVRRTWYRFRCVTNTIWFEKQ